MSGNGRRNMTWEEAARELAKAARNALDEASPAGPVPETVQFAEACMMGISVLMRRTIHFNRWKKRWAERKAAVLAEVGAHCNPPAKVVTEDDVIEEPEVGEKKDGTTGTDGTTETDETTGTED